MKCKFFIVVSVASLLSLLGYYFSEKQQSISSANSLISSLIEIRKDSEALQPARSPAFNKLIGSEKLDQVHSKTISPTFRLAQVWTAKVSNQLKQSQPAICGEYVVAGSLDGVVSILSNKSGTLLEQLRFVGPAARRGLSCDEINEKHVEVFVPTGEGVNAFSIKDGQVRQLNKFGQGFIAVAPLFTDTQVIVAQMNPSRVQAYDRITGEMVWDLPIGSQATGSNIWSGFTLSTDKKIMVANTGSPYGWNRVQINDPVGENSNSIIVIETATGKVLWRKKFIKKDFWDVDMVGPPVVLNSGEGYRIISFNKLLGALRVDLLVDEELQVIGAEVAVSGSAYEEKNAIQVQSDGESHNTLVIGQVAPILKRIRVFDGYSGGPQWPGGIYDEAADSVYFLQNSANWLGEFVDVEPEDTDYSEFANLSACVECHSADGKVRVNFRRRGLFVPSLFLTTKLYSKLEFHKYISSGSFHNAMSLSDRKLALIYDTLASVDNGVLRSGRIRYFSEFDTRYHAEQSAEEDYEGPKGEPSVILRAFDFNVSSDRWKNVVAKTFEKSCDENEVQLSASQGGIALVENSLIGASRCGGIVSFDAASGSFQGMLGKIKGEATAPPVVFRDTLHQFVLFPSAQKNSGSFISLFKIEFEPGDGGTQ